MFALQGPPGTGKTEVTSEAVAAFVDKEPVARVLVSAQSHDALDNLAERITRKLGITVPRGSGQDAPVRPAGPAHPERQRGPSRERPAWPS